jgi:hypothetical protein
VNAIAKEITEYIVKDPTIPITADLVNQATEILIKRQGTHLDSLAERLREDRVRAIIQPSWLNADGSLNDLSPSQNGIEKLKDQPK